jgi:hypothetical protein
VGSPSGEVLVSASGVPSIAHGDKHENSPTVSKHAYKRMHTIRNGAAVDDGFALLWTLFVGRALFGGLFPKAEVLAVLDSCLQHVRR